MSKKQFMVVELPTSDETGHSMLSEPAHFTDYGDAFDAVNELVVNDGNKQLFKQPKGENPLRVTLSDRDVELWVISRTDELLKLK